MASTCIYAMIHVDQPARQPVFRHDRIVAVEASWDAEYRRGRYSDEPPVGFADDIVAAARGHGVSRGLYVGCGNGRNEILTARNTPEPWGHNDAAQTAANVRPRY